MSAEKSNLGLMRPNHRLARLQRNIQVLPRIAPPTRLPKTIGRRPSVVSVPDRMTERAVTAPSFDFQPDPYLDYARHLTLEGGVLMIYKDVDTRLRHILWRLGVWSLFTGTEACYFAPYEPAQQRLAAIVALLVLGVLNFLIVRKPIELYRRIEVRPDCLIIEGQDIFWRRYMEGGVPAFNPHKDGNQILSGIYGTRFVEYLTVRRFDENDRMAEVVTAHFKDAIRQQWSRPQ